MLFRSGGGSGGKGSGEGGGKGGKPSDRGGKGDRGGGGEAGAVAVPLARTGPPVHSRQVPGYGRPSRLRRP